MARTTATSAAYKGLTVEFQENDNDELSHNHKNAVNSTLLHVSELLDKCEAMTLISEGSETGEYVQTLTVDQKNVSLAGIENLRSAIRELQEQVHIQNFTPKIKTFESIMATLSFIQIAFDDMRSKNLRNYGMLSEGNAEYIDRVCENFERAVSGLKSDLRESKYV